MFMAVRVTIDNTFHAFAFGVLPVAPVEIEAVGVGVEFNPRAGGRADVNDGLLVELLRRAA